MEIIKVPFPDTQYVKVLTAKDIFIIHHTAGRDNAEQMYNIWATDTQGRVCTAYGITRNGKIYQGFSTKYWGYALRINAPSNNIPAQYRKATIDATINARAIQVELCNWGGLKRGTDDKLYAWPSNFSKVVVPESEAIFYPNAYRGFNWFHVYPSAQIQALQKLILFHHEQDDIVLDYQEDMWETTSRALKGTPGIWTHTSYRTDKSDCHPQPELIQMLRGLAQGNAPLLAHAAAGS